MMPQIYTDFEQGSSDWYAIRRGIVTASEFSTVLAKGKDGGASKTRATYMRKLAGEIITGECAENYSNAYMERGKALEDEARDLYAFLHDEQITRVAFIKNCEVGCSPDAILGERGMLEIKTEAPHILIETLLKDEFPPEHRAQCQGGLWVAERDFIDIVCYFRKMPLFVKRAWRDEGYIKTLSEAVDKFTVELHELVAKVKAY